MELIIINENKIKITLSDEEMKKYGVCTEEVGLSFPNARYALRAILLDADVEEDFYSDCDKNRIFIQLYPSIDGGCEMFVTKMDLISSNNYWEENVMPAYKEQSLAPQRPSRKPSVIKRTTLTYRFDRLDWLISACRELTARGFSGESALYRDKEGRYYLLLSGSADADRKFSASSFLSEFAELENTDRTYLYICENGHCICPENAIGILSDL